VVCDVFVKAGSEIYRLSEALRDSLSENAGSAEPRDVQKENKENLREKGETREYLRMKGVCGQS
jgi:hypothetical protein